MTSKNETRPPDYGNATHRGGANVARSEDEVTVRDVLNIIVANKWIILAIITLTMVASLTASLVITKKYMATTVVTTVSTTNMGGGLEGAKAALSGLSGLASMIGISSGSVTPEAVDVATLKSEFLTRRFIEQGHLMPVLFSSLWNAEDNRWRVKRKTKIPTLWLASRIFRKKIVAVDVDKKTGLIKVSILWTNPVLAARWANGLVAMANAYFRSRAIAKAQRSIKYLEKQVSQTSDIGVKEGIYSLIQQEMGKAMLAQGTREYALRVVDPAFKPELAYTPRPVLWTIAGMFFGMLLSVGLVIIRASWNAEA